MDVFIATTFGVSLHVQSASAFSVYNVRCHKFGLEEDVCTEVNVNRQMVKVTWTSSSYMDTESISGLISNIKNSHLT